MALLEITCNENIDDVINDNGPGDGDLVGVHVGLGAGPSLPDH